MSLDPELLALEQELRALKPVEVDFPLSQRLVKALDDEYTTLVQDGGFRVLEGAAPPLPAARRADTRQLVRRWWPTAAAACLAFAGGWWQGLPSSFVQNGEKSVPHASPAPANVEWLGPSGSADDFARRLQAIHIVPQDRSPVLNTARGSLGQAFLGVTILDLTPEVRGQLSDAGVLRTESGVLVLRVVEGSPAFKAGLRPMDIVTHFNGQKVESVEHMQFKVQMTTPGRPLTLTVLRDGKEMTVSAQVDIGPVF